MCRHVHTRSAIVESSTSDLRYNCCFRRSTNTPMTAITARSAKIIAAQTAARFDGDAEVDTAEGREVGFCLSGDVGRSVGTSVGLVSDKVSAGVLRAFRWCQQERLD